MPSFSPSPTPTPTPQSTNKTFLPRNRRKRIMAGIWILGHFYLNLSLYKICVFVIIVCLGSTVNATGGVGYNSFTVSSFTYDRTELKPYEWRYIRADLPPWFSVLTISLDSDVDLEPNSTGISSKSTLPIICVREGSPPLPDAYNSSLTGLVLGPISNGSFGFEGLQFSEKCYPMQKNILLRLTNEQIPSGVWYFGLFNGIGALRTQSKMINRGSKFSFNGNLTVEGCMAPMTSGQFCNQTIDQLSCVNFDNYNQTSAIVVSCRNDDANSCSGNNETKVYSLDIMGISEKITITTANVRLNITHSSNGTRNSSDIGLMCYARHAAIPSLASHDYSGSISNAPLVIQSPKVGRWYIIIQPFNLSNTTAGAQDMSAKVCYSLEWKLLQCPVDKTGLNCTWERYMLQTVTRKSQTTPFESYYLPVTNRMSSESATFLLEPLLSNSSNGLNTDFSWTYFLLDIPSGAAGGNIHIRMAAETGINYEIYVKYGGLPTDVNWDYFYANMTSNSNGSMFFKLYDVKEEAINFYLLYARGGTWVVGLKHVGHAGNASENQTTMSISVERCPRRCSSHGACLSVLDMTGSLLYSFCSCDRNHGGFDCSVEIVSHQGHIWQSISLIASNAAAVFPAYYALRHKAFAEWVLFTTSGVSSGLYHACDVGTWCALSFRVLQFMDFWLSFMAVVSTFVYLATINEASKRTIHTVVAILTALMAETQATRSSNIVLVIAIGTLGLLIGWLIEFLTNHRSLTFSMELFLNINHRWQTVRGWIGNLMNTLLKRFRWGFVVGGFIALAMAAISWKLETSQSYWIWHSLWHVSIYTSSFLFLCSKVKMARSNNQRPPDTNYELTRQDSLSRG